MNKRLKALHDKLQGHIDRQQALLAKDEWTEEEKAEAAGLPAEIASIKAEIEGVKGLEAAAADADSFLNGAGAITPVSQGAATPAAHVQPATTDPAAVRGLQPLQPSQVAGAIQAPTRSAPAVVLARARPKYFAMVPGKTREQAAETAYRFGMFLLASMKNNKRAQQFCHANGIPVALLSEGHTEGINEDGGFLVPAEFENDMIDLREMYGVFRQFARNSPMASDVKSRPRRRGGLEAYFVDEGEEADESKGAWDRVTLTARKLMVNTRMSSELSEDAIVDLGDKLAGEIAYAFAKKEDNCGFNGDGSATYGRITGVRKKLVDTHGVDGGPSLILGSGNAWSELTLENFTAVVGALPEYAETSNVRWFCHKTFYATVMLQLMLESGGVTAAEVSSGAVWKKPVFLGSDVVFVQIMPKTEANSQVPVVYGDLALAADYGDRRQTTLAMSEHVHFKSDELALRGTERFDINVHDVGDDEDAGPIVGLITAAG